MYGKWTEYLKSADLASYEEYIHSNPNRLPSYVFDCKNFVRILFIFQLILFFSSSKDTTKDNMAHTPRKMLAKLNSLTISSFKHSSTDEVSINR